MSDEVIPKALYMVHYYYPSSGQALCHSFLRGSHLLHLISQGIIHATRLLLGAVKLFGMHIIPPLTFTAGTHFTLPTKGWRV